MVNSNKVESKLLAQASQLSGEYSPDGSWVVVGIANISDNKFSAEVSVMAEGMVPIWVNP